jgi:glyoxylase I family protein
MRILGLIFAGSATERRPELTRFAADVLGLAPMAVDGASADMFSLPDGSTFAVSGPRELGETSRTIGFEVADLEEAIADLHAAGVETDGIAENSEFRYTHFRPPDGELYELVERRTPEHRR